MKIAVRSCVLAAIPSVLAFVAGCGAKEKLGGAGITDSSVKRLVDAPQKAASSGDSAAKKDDSLEAELAALKAKFDSFYKDYTSFKISVDGRFKSLEEKLQGQIDQLKSDLAKVESRVAGLENWRDTDYKTTIDGLLRSIGTINTTIKTMNATADATTERINALENGLNTRLAEITANAKALEGRVGASEKDLAAYKIEAAATFATQKQLNDVKNDVAALNTSLVTMYTELKAKDEALAARNDQLETSILGVSNDLQGLKGEFKGHVTKYAEDVKALGSKMDEKIAALETSIVEGDRAVVEQMRNELTKQSEEFGSRLNTYSVALNGQLAELRKTVGENHADFVAVSKKLREAQASHQAKIASLGQKIAAAQKRLTDVEDVAKKAVSLSESNSRAIGLLSTDFETQKKAVAERFGLTEDKIEKVSSDLAAFKQKTNERFEEVRKEAAAMVANLNTDTQKQFATLNGDVASLTTRVGAHDRSIGALAQKVSAVQGSVDYLVKVQAFERAYGQKVDVSMDGVKALIIALVDVEQEFVKALNLSRENRGPFDPSFRSELSRADVCGVQDAALDFARASDVDYFRWIAQVYVRNLVFNMRAAEPEPNKIFQGRGLMVDRDSLLALVMQSILRLEGRSPAPAGCFAAIDSFSQRALLGATAASLEVRTRLMSPGLAEAIKTLEQRIAYVKGPMGDLESWLAAELKALKADERELSRAEIAQSIFSRAKAVLDINDRRAEMSKFAELSIEMTLNGMADQNFRAKTIAQLQAIQATSATQLAQMNARLTALANAQTEADKALKVGLEAQIKALNDQVVSNKKQVEVLSGVVDTNAADLKNRQTALATEMRRGFTLLNGKVDGIAAEVNVLEKEGSADAQKREQALESVFSILATMAARAGDQAMLEVINDAGVNFSGDVPALIPTFKPVVKLVQHYFTGGFVKGSAAACLSLDENTIKRSPFDWLCNVNFRSLSQANRLGTANTAVVRLHGDFAFVDVEAHRASVWGWDLNAKLVAKTHAARYRAPGVTGFDGAKILTQVAGRGSAHGGRGVYDLPDGGALMASLIDGSLQQFNGVIKVRPGRVSGLDVVGGGYEKVGNEYLGPQVQYIVGLYSPIVLNFGSKELVTLPPSAANVRFDLNANGIPETTGWIPAQGAGFLALPNAAGDIVNGEHLFGQATRLAGTSKRASNGYEALAQYDTKGKGYIDATDPVFAKLVVWFDRDSNGIASPSEKVPLSRLGITKVATTYAERPASAQFQGNGLLDSNQLKYESAFWGPKECGAQGCTSYDVFFGASEFVQAAK